MAHLWVFLGHNSPKYGPILLLFLKESKTLFQKIFENSNFDGNRTYPKFALFFRFSQIWGSFSRWRRPISKKLNTCQDKSTPSGYPKIGKSRSYLVAIFQEKYDYFLSYFGRFLVKKRAWSNFKGQESKVNLAVAGVTTLGSRICKGFGPTICRSWAFHSEMSFFF